MKYFIRIIAIISAVILLNACASNSNHSIDEDKERKLAYIHYQLGVDAISKAGMLPKAFDELMKSNSILPNQAHVLDVLAYAWLLRGDFKKSEAYYLKALQYGTSASIHNNYANLLNKLKRFTEAEKSARKALDDPRYPNQDLAFINLGNALLGQKKFIKATRSFQQAKLFNASNSITDFRLADAYFQQHKWHEARLLYEMIIQKQPSNRSAVEGLLAVLNKQHNKYQARMMLKQFSAQTSAPLDKAWALTELDALGQP